MNDPAERVRSLTGSSSEIVLIPYDEAYETGFEDMQRRRPDTSRIASMTGWAPPGASTRSSPTSPPICEPEASREALRGLLGVTAGSAPLSTLAVAVSIRIAQRLGIHDRPDGGRKVQEHPIPKFGGVVVAVAFQPERGGVLALLVLGRTTAVWLAIGVLVPPGRRCRRRLCGRPAAPVSTPPPVAPGGSRPASIPPLARGSRLDRLAGGGCDADSMYYDRLQKETLNAEDPYC